MSRERDRAHRRRTKPALPGAVVGGRRAVTEAIRAGRAAEVLMVSSPKVTQGMRALLEAAEREGVRVTVTPRARLDAMADDHQGVVARLEPSRDEGSSPVLSERDLAGHPFADDAVVVVLDGITDPQNLGAAARSAEAAGAAMLVTRIKRAADVTPSAVKASAGALLHLPHARVANIARAIERLQQVGFWVVGLDGEAEHAVDGPPAPAGKIALVVGSEGEGMTRLVRERCDDLVRLPMHGKVASLNASASLAAVLYAWILPTRNAAVRLPAIADR